MKPLAQAYADWIAYVVADLGIESPRLPILYLWRANIPVLGYCRERMNPATGETTRYVIGVRRDCDCVPVVLAHELRHAWQHLTGQLSYHKQHFAIWHGVTYDKRTAPEPWPWEIDAMNYHTRMETLCLK